MYEIPRSWLILVLFGTIAIAAASTILASGRGLNSASILVIWLVTLVLVALAGFTAQDRAPDTTRETKPDQTSERTNELIAENNRIKKLFSEKTEFFSGTVAELRIPLTSIDGNIELLRDRHLGKITKEQKESLNDIDQEINHITRMIIDIVEFNNLVTKSTPLKKEDVLFNNIINEVTEYMQPTIDIKGIKLHTTISPDLPTIHGDQQRLTHAFSNIIGNAIKCTLENDIAITADAENGELLISIADSGTGVPEGVLDKVFDPFYKVNATSKGTGLGLPTAKKIIEMHGGRIWAERREDRKGSIFRFAIPIS
ncbi:MAG: HAMP domain-containing histidine kinase [Methanosarcinales archaeon]|nr:MAG: HAMP domain-containing histidine kinase [Methanosarcinales archaeon]